MKRLTKFVTPVGKCMTSLDSFKHYMPCIVCREKAQIKKDSKGLSYTEKFGFCDTCEVKMLFNRLKEYEDAEEQGLLLRLPCKVGDTVYHVVSNMICGVENVDLFFLLLSVAEKRFGKTVFLTKEEAERALKRLEEEKC